MDTLEFWSIEDDNEEFDRPQKKARKDNAKKNTDKVYSDDGKVQVRRNHSRRFQ